MNAYWEMLREAQSHRLKAKEQSDPNKALAHDMISVAYSHCAHLMRREVDVTAHCSKGHPLTEDSVLWKPDIGKGGRTTLMRTCKLCQRERERQSRKRAREEAVDG